MVVDDRMIGEIGPGLLLLLGIDKTDSESNADKLIQKVLNYRVFADQDDKMNLSVRDVAGGVLVVSQFTLSADTHKGLRPSFSSAAHPQEAQRLYQYFKNKMSEQYDHVAFGQFGADMKVQLINDGPVTFMLNS